MFEDLSIDVVNWGYDIGLFDSINGSDIKSQGLKLVSEVGELLDEVNKDTCLDNIKNELGDVLVCLLMLMEFKGIDVNECLLKAYNKIKVRKGKMINGVFIKDEDL